MSDAPASVTDFASAAPARREKRPMTPADKAKLELYARKIEQVTAWEESADRSATLARLYATHGDLLDQVLSEPIVPAVLEALEAHLDAHVDLVVPPVVAAAAAAVVAPELEPAPTVTLALAPAPAAPPVRVGRIDFRGYPLND